MKYVDFPAIQKNFEYFWNHEYFGRCALRLTAPIKPVSSLIINNYEDMIKEWCDGETRLKRNRTLSENTYYLGEAFPLFFINLGAAGNAGYFKNIKYEFTKDTLWFFPINNNDELIFSKDSFLYKSTIDLAKYFADNANGEFILGMPGCSSNIDALAHLRGTEQLLMNLIDNPEKVKEDLKAVQKSWFEIVNDVYRIISKNYYGGSATWLGTYAKGFHSQLQSDISVMLSPDQFDDFVLEDLQLQSEILEYPCYHLDGQEQILHLDKLLSIKNLRLIQYTFCAGQPTPAEQIPVLKRIQKSGKLLLLFLEPKYVKPILENLSAKNLFINTSCRNPDEADQIFKIVQDYSKER
ncbi:MAG: hypothetical protein FWD78_01835 [Treponema sp.]|nr:hypothetical protein [Treponema sp.]